MGRLIFACLWAVLAVAVDACNDVGDCPGAGAVAPDGTCTGDMLSCPYDMATASPACDGTNTTISTSCVCTKGKWACPSPVSCPGDATADGGGRDASSGDDGGGGGD